MRRPARQSATCRSTGWRRPLGSKEGRKALTRLTAGAPIEIERVRLTGGDSKRIAIEGRFELPPLARLTAEDQVFVAAFVRSHGSTEEMEQSIALS